ncbi:hypothetical protein ES332_D01G058400v1 [Gossypium tomentosum]|uniref:Leucine-rich repeat-containing N-terminal plant-type domain-containing protein n=1 Tax=Gossypium tomentosum TaxID=34277 RepID=A0A5D2M650_GOSTO|nr:hypothetical protein ES332_D01G058400v1 [Gossypium tomentosum]
MLRGHLLLTIDNLTLENHQIIQQFFSRIHCLKSLIFAGHIPVTLGNLKDLQVLDLAYNDFSGTLSSLEINFLSSLANCNDLRFLGFGGNPLITGYLNPASIGNLSVSLQYFYVSGCNINCSIPGEICNLTNLRLHLSSNFLRGPLQIDFGNWNVAEYLDFLRNQYLALSDNQLEGILPLSLINCSELVALDVAGNHLSDTFPHWLGMLPKLRVLILRSNKFHGSIQDSNATSSFSKLQMLDLSHNDFTSLLPTKFFQNLKALKEVIEYRNDSYRFPANVTIKGLELKFAITVRMPIFSTIDLSMNGFHGKIPEVVGELSLLHALNLSHNNLTGPIPTSFGNLIGLESLDFSFNKLMVRFQNNNLVGPIPHGKQFGTFENDSYIGNLGLCGLPLSKECNNDERPEAVQDEEGNGNGIAFIWKVAMMGYGCGMILGISMAFIVFTTGKPRWLVRMIERELQNKFSSWFQKEKN